jgi:hypothetical protein
VQFARAAAHIAKAACVMSTPVLFATTIHYYLFCSAVRDLGDHTESVAMPGFPGNAHGSCTPKPLNSTLRICGRVLIDPHERLQPDGEVEADFLLETESQPVKRC